MKRSKSFLTRYAVSDADATSITAKTFQAFYTTATRRLTYTLQNLILSDPSEF